MNDQFKSILGVHNEATNRLPDPTAPISDTAASTQTHGALEIHISPRHGGADRWMLRVFGISDISRIIPAPASQSFLGKS